MPANIRNIVVIIAMIGAAPSAFANVITDWDEKAIAAVTPMASLGGTNPYSAQRMMALVHVAMFDAVNSIERRYRPYLVQLPAGPTTSKEAAAAVAAAAVLATVEAKTAAEMKTTLAAYLASIADGAAKADGIKLGEAIAAKVLEARANDGSNGCGRVSAEGDTRRLCADVDHDLLHVAGHEAVRHRQRIAIPTKAAYCVRERGMGIRLQRAQRLWRAEQYEANSRAIGDGPILACRPARGLSLLRPQARDRKADERRRQCTVHGAGRGWDHRLHHRSVGCQVSL